MAKKFYEELRQALLEVKDIVEGRADPSTYRVLVPDPATGRLVHVPGVRTGPAASKLSSERAVEALAERRRRRRYRATHTALFGNLYSKRYGADRGSDSAEPALHAAE